MARLWLGVFAVVILGALGVARWVARPPAPRGYSGIEFARVTEAAALRAPLLSTRGALVAVVAEKSPAAQAGIKAGAVVAAIDGITIASARQASQIVRAHKKGDRVAFTLFDEAKGPIRPKIVAVTFDDAPPVSETIFTVESPRTLVKERFALPGMVANASWSRRLTHGVSVRPRAMPQLSAGSCSGVAPEKWQVRDGAAGLIHLASADGRLHAIYKLVPLSVAERGDPKGYVLGLIHAIFRSPVMPAPSEDRAFGVSSFGFGNRNGLAGFALWRMNGAVLSVWIAGVPAGDVSWAMPVAASALLSLRCESQLAPSPRPRDPALTETSLSTHCLNGKCEDSDFAATYLDKFRLGYVHAHDGTVFLVNPRKDLWANGQEGPGFYRQLGGENEKLEPGRTN
ncbi:MAG TPA: PDZ domain-containing protein [Rhizomicrobium sp.]|nr:PDZ domain-containing protein [Rhizomicrobium sp.]